MATSVSELASFLTEQAEWAAVGRLAELSNITGGVELQTLAAQLVTSVAEQEGLDLSGYSTETAGLSISGLKSLGRAALKWLGRASDNVLAKLSANLGVLAVLGGVYVSYNWLTYDDQIRYEEERQLGETVRSALDSMPPEDKRAVLGQLMSRSEGITTKHVLLGLGAVAAFYVAYRWFGR